ncbi:uncharacterized protein LTR77_007909 [Saxophila tyrrhenica]|uniref:Uncharacterized protein n=1 Tax=Saxophila tyrrhenica TaxID=1690608 RepID=A0AAV9P3G7_9PEZI|nr:hypothetical protein LTR77_007909 [Saxophila tyrrhenica]
MANDNNSGGDDWSLFPYEPVKAAPIVFAVFLTVIGVYQIYQSFWKYHWKKFGGIMTWATTVWISGFITRAISVHQPHGINIFIAQFVLILMGPPLYAAAEYFILGRLMSYLPYHTVIHPGRVISTFVILSVIVESLTANGAANSAGEGRTPAQVETGLACLKAALIVQSVIEVFYLTLVGSVEWKCRKARCFPRNVRVVCYTLYITSTMMLVRCIVRTIEGFEAAACRANPAGPPGHCGEVSTHEAYLWVFEIANITLFVVILALFHPGKYLPRDSRIFLDPIDGKTERVGPGYSKADKRPMLATILDPFNLFGIVTGKGMAIQPFWNEHQPIYDGGEVKEDKRGERGQSAEAVESGSP